MKNTLTSTLITLAFAFSVQAADKHEHDHDHKIKAGPTGGRLITKVEPHAEFFVTKDKKIEIRFIDDHNKVVAPVGQIVTVTMGDRKAPTKIAFTRAGDKLVSDRIIPDGEKLPTVVQIQVAKDAKALTEKFNLDLAHCSECKHDEYACTCDHAH